MGPLGSTAATLLADSEEEASASSAAHSGDSEKSLEATARRAQ